MGNDISIIIGTTIGIIVLLILLIVLIIYCYKRYEHKQEDLVIINKNARSISFINSSYHNNMTLLASPRRLAILELQQQEEMFTYENPSLDLNELIQSKTVRF